MISSDFLFFVEPQNITNGFATIDGQEASHITQVLRHKSGDRIYFTNGKGELFSGILQQVNKKNCTLQIEEKEEGWDKKEQVKYPVLCVGLIKKRQRLEFMIEKLIEIGISKLYLFQADRSERNRTNTNRLESIAVSAMKQSKRTVLPDIKVVNSLSVVIEEMDSEKDRLVLLDQFADQSGSDFLKKETHQLKKWWAVVGPEGGLTDKETNLCHNFDKNIATIHIGNARLRAETAAIVAATYLQKGE